MLKRCAWIGLLVLGVAVCGCNQKKEEKKFPVRGTVSLDGKPLPDGRVYFKMVEAGVFDVVQIKEGKFEGQVRPGRHRVEIEALRDAPLDPVAVAMYGDKAKEMGGGKENYLPAKYNTESTLSEEVKSSGTNEFKFELTTK